MRPLAYSMQYHKTTGSLVEEKEPVFLRRLAWPCSLPAVLLPPSLMCWLSAAYYLPHPRC